MPAPFRIRGWDRNTLNEWIWIGILNTEYEYQQRTTKDDDSALNRRHPERNQIPGRV